ncbi:uncharacterized protein LOC5520082 [Nematostella vectensis]|uniref:uncharacterized protein LOC5520082 n=1 Tax=Nematostella vectensis TaxID=45351 RepID=UPI00207747F6|nr:uncharacterized protein LOC5520082 [Nematostella vectensis]
MRIQLLPMCCMKWHSVGPRFLWRFVACFASYLLILGAISFGLGIKLMEYAERPDLTPVISGLPTLVAGILGLFGRLGKKKWTVTCFTVACVISGVLSVHMTYRFIGKEVKNLPLYDERCRSEREDSNYHCILQVGTVILSVVAAMMIPILPVGLGIYFTANRILKNKECYILCCLSFGDTSPSHEKVRAPPKGHYLRGRADEPVARYTSTGSLSHPNTTTKTTRLSKEELEYLPMIPNFKDLAKENDKDGLEYRAEDFYSGDRKDEEKEKGAEKQELSKAMSQTDVVTDDVDFLVGNTLYRYDTLEELRMGYLDQTLEKRTRAKAVSDVSDIHEIALQKEKERENEANDQDSAKDVPARSEELLACNDNLGYLAHTPKDKCPEGFADSIGNKEVTPCKPNDTSPLRTRRGVNLTLKGSGDFFIQGNPSAARTGIKLSRPWSHNDLQTGSTHIDTSPTDPWTPNRTPRGRLSFVELDTTLAIDKRRRYASEGDVSPSKRPITQNDLEISGDHRGFKTGEQLNVEDLSLYRDEQMEAIDELFSKQERVWLSSKGDREESFDLLMENNITREELDELLPYIL